MEFGSWFDDNQSLLAVTPLKLYRGQVSLGDMHQQHGVALGEGELQMFMEWSQNDPPEEWEFERNDRIDDKQGNSKPFVTMWPRLEE